MLVKVQKLSILKGIDSGDLLCSTVNIINNTVYGNCLALGGEVPSLAPKGKTSHLETKNVVITDGQNVFLEHLGLSKSH